jgi:hypothetical protein
MGAIFCSIYIMCLEWFCFVYRPTATGCLYCHRVSAQLQLTKYINILYINMTAVRKLSLPWGFLVRNNEAFWSHMCSLLPTLARNVSECYVKVLYVRGLVTVTAVAVAVLNFEDIRQT